MPSDAQGKTPPAPSGIGDELAFLSGVIEGKAAYNQHGLERTPARVIPFPAPPDDPR
jgi:hypothetical protein